MYAAEDLKPAWCYRHGMHSNGVCLDTDLVEALKVFVWCMFEAQRGRMSCYILLIIKLPITHLYISTHLLGFLCAEWTCAEAHVPAHGPGQASRLVEISLLHTCNAPDMSADIQAWHEDSKHVFCAKRNQKSLGDVEMPTNATGESSDDPLSRRDGIEHRT